MQAKQLQHLDELLTLQDMSKDRDQQIKYVDEQNKKFDQLLEVVNAGRLSEYSDKKKVVKAFGEPILAKSIVEDGQPAEEWLYRYATKYFNSDKIYLYFDGQGNLIRGQHVVPAAPNVASTAPEAETPHGQN